MQSLQEFIRRVPAFAALTHAHRIKHFVWFLQTIQGKDSVNVQDVRSCYDVAHVDLPANLHRSMDALTEKIPPDLLKQNGRYRLHATRRAELDARYGTAEASIVVERTLAELPSRLRNEGERLYLDETLTCYRHGALRATIVMSWNLAYDHLLNWILSDPTRLAQFNQGIPKRSPKKVHVKVATRADFEELKEDEVIDIAGALPGITANMKRSLKEKLGRRNAYAHPSTMGISRHQVDDMISDLVNNIVLLLP